MQEYWQWFLKLNARRPSGMGISAIPYSEMESFFKLYTLFPDPCEIEIVEIFDKIAMKEFSEQSDKEQKRNQKSKPKS